MKVHALNPIVLRLGMLILVGCTPPNYAPVRVVNQPIPPDNGYVGREPQESQGNDQGIPQKQVITAQGAYGTQKNDQNSVGNDTSVEDKELSQRPKDQLKHPPTAKEIVTARANFVERKPDYRQTPTMSKTAASPNKTSNEFVQDKKADSKKEKPGSSGVAFAKEPSKNKLSLTNSQRYLAQAPAKSSPNIKNSNERKANISIDNKKMLKLNFDWPIWGKIAHNFSQTDKKGIDITGKIGEAVHASEAGQAVYCGQGLAGFGNLVVIKHNDAFLTAYAHNSQLHVKEGQQVKKGQKIGQIGTRNSKKASLHFEIRKNGKPVNPLTLLPKR